MIREEVKTNQVRLDHHEQWAVWGVFKTKTQKRRRKTPGEVLPYKSLMGKPGYVFHHERWAVWDVSKTKTQKRRPKTPWTKTKTLWTKTKIPWTKTKTPWTKTKTLWTKTVKRRPLWIKL